MANVAFLGLGVMGFPMAGHLLTRGGHDVTVYNRTPARAQDWLAKFPNGKSAPTPAAAAKGAEFVFACVGNDADVRAVTTGTDGAFAAMSRGSIFIDNTTTSAELARELSQAASAKDLYFIDAPVSGGQAGAAASGSLLVGGTFRVRAGVLESFLKRHESKPQPDAPVKNGHCDVRTHTP